MDGGDIVPPSTSGGVNDGDDMWNKLVSKHSNIVLVLSGHDPSESIVVNRSTGVNGNVVTSTVTFKDWNGTVLKIEQVETGKAATAPAAPTRDGYVFSGWNTSYGVITSDLVVTATYTADTAEPVLSVESMEIAKGTDEVTVNVRIRNNPGIMGAVLKVSVDDSVFDFKTAQKTAYPSLSLTNPGPGRTASPYTFLLDAMELTEADRGDGVLFTITLTVKDLNAVGTFDVTLSYEDGAIFDEYYNTPTVVLEKGTITIA